jgi:hypothetical protein
LISISRVDLYEKLWSIGISKTAKELNVPHNKLKNICISNDIPLPTASYWSSLRMGNKKPTQPFLPNEGDNPLIIIEKIKVKSIHPQKILSLTSGEKVKITTVNELPSAKNEIPIQPEYFTYFDIDDQLLFTQIYNSLKVNKSFSSKPHKEIVKYRQKKENIPYFREAKLKINSSSGVITPEALSFIDSLFKALENVGAKILVAHEETQILYKSYIFTLNFKLPSNKVLLSLNDKEYSTYKTFKYVSNGKLNVEVGYRLEWLRWHKHEKSIKQTNKDTLNDLIKKIFLYIFSLPQKIDEKVRIHIIDEEKKREEEEQKSLLKNQHDNEYKLTEELLKKSIYHFYSQVVKNYIVSELDPKTTEYNWAMNKSNWIKDSNDNPDSLLSSKDKENLINFKLPKVFTLD